MILVVSYESFRSSSAVSLGHIVVPEPGPTGVFTGVLKCQYALPGKLQPPVEFLSQREKSEKMQMWYNIK